MSAVTMPFGKHKGMALTELPALYLDWLSKQELRDPLKSNLEAEVKRRAAQTPASAVSDDDEPLPEALRDDEAHTLASRCPRCGHRLSVFVRLTK